jgi:hypothetical protein
MTADAATQAPTGISRAQWRVFVLSSRGASPVPRTAASTVAEGERQYVHR